MNKNNFYVDLISNSSFDYFPDNSLSDFKTKLNQIIELDDDWDVGLSDIYFPLSIHNIKESVSISLTYRVAMGKKFKDYILETDMGSAVVCLEPGHYKSIHDILDRLNSGFKNLWDNRKTNKNLQGSKCLSFELNTNGYVEMKVFKFNYENSQIIYMPIIRSEELGQMLGIQSLSSKDITEDTSEYLRMTGSREVDIRAGQNFLMIYCDIIKPRLVGDSLSQLLRTVTIPTGNKEEYAVNIFSTPQYHPLSKRRIETINIHLASETGKQIHFGNGRVHLSLHFRKRQ